MLKNILLGLAVIIVAFFTYVAMQPKHYEIGREIRIAATAGKIFPYINNSQLLNSWGPWSDIDPSVQMNTSGPAEGLGATSSWNSKGKMGVGKATIIESVLHHHVVSKIEYTKPAMVQTSTLAILADGNGSIVRWSVVGENNFMMLAMCVFMRHSIDEMVGGMFDLGLKKLKTKLEQG